MNAWLAATSAMMSLARCHRVVDSAITRLGLGKRRMALVLARCMAIRQP